MGDFNLFFTDTQVDSNYLIIGFSCLRQLSNVFADWLVIQFVLKVEFHNRVTANCPYKLPHIQHHQIIAHLYLAVPIRFPAQIVNVHIPIVELFSPELLVCQPLTLATTRLLINLCWILFGRKIFLWIHYL